MPPVGSSHDYPCRQVSTRLHITAIVINQIGSTAGQSQGQDNLSHRIYKKCYPCKNNQDDAGFPAHNGWIMQRLANGYIAINGHEDRTKISIEPKKMQCKDMNQALIV